MPSFLKKLFKRERIEHRQEVIYHGAMLDNVARGMKGKFYPTVAQAEGFFPNIEGRAREQHLAKELISFISLQLCRKYIQQDGSQHFFVLKNDVPGQAPTASSEAIATTIKDLLNDTFSYDISQVGRFLGAGTTEIGFNKLDTIDSAEFKRSVAIMVMGSDVDPSRQEVSFATILKTKHSGIRCFAYHFAESHCAFYDPLGGELVTDGRGGITNFMRVIAIQYLEKVHGVSMTSSFKMARVDHHRHRRGG